MYQPPSRSVSFVFVQPNILQRKEGVVFLLSGYVCDDRVHPMRGLYHPFGHSKSAGA